jgi:hypothetical protein
MKPRSVRNRKERNKPKLSLQLDEKSTDPSVSSSTSMKKVKSKGKQIGITLWRVLVSELNIGKEIKENQFEDVLDSEHWNDNIQLLLSYIKLPIEVEHFMLFGLLYSTVVFLKWLIIIPSRWLIHTILFGLRFFKFEKSHKHKISKTLLIMYKNDTLSMSGILITLVLLKNLDTSRIYHNIRSGTAIKLYFMTQVLELADKLLSASGQDILKVLYQFTCVSNNNKYSIIKILQFITLYLASIIYLWFHSYVLVYQVMALNVAINSYSNALLTLILSNQFSELKSAVFKKTEREGLFQIACSDLNERFLILIMLGIISSRNFLQIIINTKSINDFFNNIKPNSWSTNFTNWKMLDDWIGLIIGPPILVIGSEVLVDWIKHAYIIRFNRIKPSIYQKFTKILASDFIKGFTSDNFSKSANHLNDHPNLLTKRTGFPISTTLIIFCKLTLFPYLKFHILNIHKMDKFGNFISSLVILFTIIALISVLIFVRLLFSLVLVQWSRKILHSKGFTSTLDLTDYVPGDPNVNASTVSDIRKSLYDLTESVPPSLEELRMKRLYVNQDEKLNNVVRFEIVDKRIW